jgi:type I restriction enzyme M protein
MDSRMGNQEKMNLYGEALTKFSEAKQLPELFRTIFRAAFLPYRSPETLGLFLKEISYFDYSHPEELGNAYEYLLSIMSSQGDAGQFRTPRHIIDFIVDVLNPTKDDKVLDPACGTAGFLVSTYNHILEQHDGKNDPKKKEKTLTPDERKKLMQNLQGYDIDPTMVRIAQVNMYLHQFKNPQIFQYDSLTSEERWSEKFDVILFPDGAIPTGDRRGVSEMLTDSTIPAELRAIMGDMNAERIKNLEKFVKEGGRVVAIGSAGKNLASRFSLPVEDALDGVKGTEYYVPSSVLRMRVEPSWLTRGYEEYVDVMFDNSPVYKLKEGATRIAWFDSATPLRSGWALGQDKLKDATAVALCPLGKGEVVLIGPEVNFRAQSDAGS